jgi:hypothetical protein
MGYGIFEIYMEIPMKMPAKWLRCLKSIWEDSWCGLFILVYLRDKYFGSGKIYGEINWITRTMATSIGTCYQIVGWLLWMTVDCRGWLLIAMDGCWLPRPVVILDRRIYLVGLMLPIVFDRHHLSTNLPIVWDTLSILSTLLASRQCNACII